MRTILLSCCLALSVIAVTAQVPQTLSYQGLLTDNQGNPVANAAYTVTFNFHTDPTATGTLQSRTVTGVQTFQGLFTTIIGNGASNSANAPLNNLVPPLGSTQYYIGVQVNSGAELTPRVPLTAVPYAFMASALEPTVTLPGAQVGTGVNASNITSGTIANTVLDADIQDLADGSLTGSKVGTGINASNITTGTLTGGTVGTGINAANITTGTLNGGMVGTGIDATNITTGAVANTVLDADLQDLADGSLTGSVVGTGINASNITTGTLAGARVGTGVNAANITIGTVANTLLDSDLQDLADGSLSGASIGAGINASNVTTGTLSGALVGSGVDAANVTTGTMANTLLDADLQDLADGTLSGSKVGTGVSATNVTTGTLTLTGTGAATVPAGTTAERPSASVGALRYNTTENVMEYYNGTNWMFITPKTAYLKDIKDPSVVSGSFSSGQWRVRDLTDLEGDASVVSLTIVSPTENYFTLEPGHYLIEATVPAYRVLEHKAGIFKVVGDELLILGTSEIAMNSDFTTSNHSFVRGFLDVTSSTAFQLRHRCALSNPDNGFGQPSSFATFDEVYAIVKITKLR